MRQLLRNIYLSISGSTKSVADGIHILNSHYISRDDVTPEVFHDLLMKLSKQADLINFNDAVDLIQNNQVKNKKCIAFSFDDGFEECYTKISSVLEDFSTNALFFINPGYIDGDQQYIENFNKNIVHVNKKPMNWNQVRELNQKGFIFGNHTYDHVKLIGLNLTELEHQIVNSKNKIEQELNSNCDYFAWTYGSMNDIDKTALDYALKNHKVVFSCDNYTNYYSNNNIQILNRRHIEGDWPISHVKHFLSKGKSY